MPSRWICKWWTRTALILVILIGYYEVRAILNSGNLPDESRLKTDLLEFYDPSVRPIYNTSTPTRVDCDLALQQIIDVDEKQQLLQATVWMRLYWKDEFMNWDPADYGGVAHLKFVPDKIWLPDICIYDALKPAVHANDMQDFYVSVDHEGNVLWLSPLVLQSVCHFNVRFFPYDIQLCNFTIGSWIYHGFEVDLWNKNVEGDTTAFKNNVEWEIDSFKITRTVTQYGCCPEPYPVLDFTLIIERRPGFYITYLYIPSVVIIVSSLFAFYLPPGSEAKVDLAVTGLLSQTVFLLLISDLMPPDAHNPPLLGECLTILLVVQAMAVVVIVIIKRIHDDSIHKDKPPAKWQYTLMNFLKYPLLLYHIDYKGGKVKYHDHMMQISMQATNLAFQSNEAIQNGTEQHANGFISSTEKKISQNGGVTLKDMESNDAFFTPVESLSSRGLSTANDDDESKFLDGSSHQTMTLILNSMLTDMNEKRERKKMRKGQEEIEEQWKNMAAMYDRILFVLFIFTIIGITVWFVTLSPSAAAQIETL